MDQNPDRGPDLRPEVVLRDLARRFCPGCRYRLGLTLEVRARWDFAKSRLHAWLQCRECRYDLTLLAKKRGLLPEPCWRPRGWVTSSKKGLYLEVRGQQVRARRQEEG